MHPAARATWRAFRKNHLTQYSRDRNRPDLDRTSHMSVHLHFGTIHPRTMLADLGKGGEAYRRQICLRDFYAQVLHFWPESGYGYWPQIPIGFLDVPYLRSTEQRLNSMLATQAAANGATLVNWYAVSIGHDACKSSSTRWVEPLVPTNAAAPIHPNKAGVVGGANAQTAYGFAYMKALLNRANAEAKA